MVTFVKYSGMHPTNNESESALRKVVIHRKIHQKLVTSYGMKMFNVLITVAETWRKRELDITKDLLNVLGAT